MTEAVRETLTIGERLKEVLVFKTAFTVHVGTLSIPVTETVITSWIVMAILIAGSLLLTRNMSLVPKGPQVFVEAFVSGLNDFFKEQLGHHWAVFAPYLGTLALFLCVSDMIAVFSPIAGFGFEPPFALKPPICIVIVSGIRYKGLGGWLKGFVKPVPFMLPFNILEYIVKPLSLALRLFGNILGAFIIMELITMLVPVFLPPVFSLYFDFFDGMIQAVVFTFLSTLYIAEAVE